MDKIKAYVGGVFKETESTIKVINPFDGSIVNEVYLAGYKELDESIISAQKIQGELASLPSYKKYSILMEIAQKLTDNRETMARTICMEAAKPLRYSLAEVDRAIQTFIIAAEESKRIPSEHLQLDWTLAGEEKEGIIKYFPLGVVAGISPFNFPLNLSVHKIAPAFAAGCPIVLKPASSTPLASLFLARLIDSTELPKGSFSVLPMNRETGNLLVTDDRIALLSFTGSPSVGWMMKNKVGKKRVVLELGGNAGVVITESADLQLAIPKCVTGAFAYSGQVCIHTQRIYVHEKVFNQFVEGFIEKTKKIKYGNPLSPDTDISTMIDQENAIRVESWIKEAINQGAKILYGGSREGSFVEPTILTDTKNKMKVCSEEIFGPVVIIERYTKFETAIAEINSSVYGLQAGVFTNNIEEQNHAFNNLRVGGVIINDTPTFRVDHMPYGGVKESGFGREGVKYAMLEMLEPRLLVRNFK